MSEFVKQYELWDEFLALWPISRLKTMTLAEYTQAGSKDTFTYWMESRLDKMGSIWGGESLKFGIYSRKNTEEKSSTSKTIYTDTHAWYTSLNAASAKEAFLKVRAYVVQLAEMAKKGDTEGIEKFKKFGEVYKWKIVFHYQNRQNPIALCFFKKKVLALYLGESTQLSMAELQHKVLHKRPSGMGILEYSKPIWEKWALKKIPVWKLSHGNPPFSEEERDRYLLENLAVMHKDTGKQQGTNFLKVPVNTFFFLCHGNNIKRLCQFTSDASPIDQDSDWLQRTYRTVKESILEKKYVEHKKGWSPRGNSTFCKVKPNDLPNFETTLLKPYFDIDLAQLEQVINGTDAIDLAQLAQIANDTDADDIEDSEDGLEPSLGMKASLNRIYYGPPGTGKTYAALQELKKFECLPKSQTEQDWRHSFLVEQIAPLKWWEGIAASLCALGGRAKVADIVAHPFLKAVASTKKSSLIRNTVWGTLQHHTLEESTTVNIKLRLAPAIFDKTTDSVWYLAGDWQEICADIEALVDQWKQGPLTQGEVIKNHELVTFHQSYGYEEFVEGLRPVLTEDDDAVSAIGYEIRPGIFKRLCERAQNDPDHQYALVIDEINRGNISKIFGELITLIEHDKRGKVHIKLPYSNTLFTVPPNLHIIGTMNTADRSLALLDTALRRRFEFVACMPDTHKDSSPLEGLTVAGIDIRRMLERMNERIETLYDRDHTIGHAYFIPLKDLAEEERLEALGTIFKRQLLPLLEEYFFEDWEKIRLVLADNQKHDQRLQFITFLGGNASLEELFGKKHNLEELTLRARFAIQDEAFTNPDAYKTIYQK